MGSGVAKSRILYWAAVHTDGWLPETRQYGTKIRHENPILELTEISILERFQYGLAILAYRNAFVHV